jgi:cytochrome c-type biogenesis protein
MSETGVLAAFLAGLASFLSPCVLPLMPGYLSYISGVSVEGMQQARGRARGRVFLHSLLFVVGFSAVFIAMGAAATTLGEFIQAKLRIINLIAGGLIVLLGLQLLGLFRVRFLMADVRYHGEVRRGLAGSFLLGMAFAFGWSPCVGPILFSILAYASTAETVWRGIGLLAAYSAGIGIPFLLIGFGVGTFLRVLDRWRGYLGWVEKAGGALLVLIGLLVMTGWYRKLSAFLIR